jgi:hypothetical protein
MKLAIALPTEKTITYHQRSLDSLESRAKPLTLP